MASPRQLPGGRGFRKGEDRRVGQSESESSRLSEIADENLWLWSIVGENIYSHVDVTGVALAQDVLSFWYLPTRPCAFVPAQVRLVVASAAASSYIEVALFSYVGSTFTRLPGTYGRFDSSSTGVKSVDLGGEYRIDPKMRLFIGLVAHGGVPVVEGYQSGASASPRAINQRQRSSHTTSFLGVYSTNEVPRVTSNEDTPLVIYLAKEAALVL